MDKLNCPYFSRCGGCQLLDMTYQEELAYKQKLAQRHLSRFGRVLPILGADRPCHYRNKVEAAFGLDRSRRVISGIYQQGSHRIVNIDHCLNEGGAVALKNLILSECPNAIINIGKNGGLCSFYAERGGLIIGYEIS